MGQILSNDDTFSYIVSAMYSDTSATTAAKRNKFVCNKIPIGAKIPKNKRSMGLRPQIIGISLQKFLDTRGTKNEQAIKQLHQEIDETVALNKPSNEGYRVPQSEDEYRERMERFTNTTVTMFENAKGVIADWFNGTVYEANEGEVLVEGEADIEAMISLIGYYFREHMSECVFLDSNGYNGGGYFDEVADAFRQHLSQDDWESLMVLSQGRTLIAPNTEMIVNWSFYSFLTLEECKSLLPSLERIWKEYQEAVEKGELVERIDDSDESGDEEVKPPSAKKQKIQPKFARVPEYFNELIPDIISWLKCTTEKELDWIMYAQ